MHTPRPWLSPYSLTVASVFPALRRFSPPTHRASILHADSNLARCFSISTHVSSMKRPRAPSSSKLLPSSTHTGHVPFRWYSPAVQTHCVAKLYSSSLISCMRVVTRAGRSPLTALNSTLLFGGTPRFASNHARSSSSSSSIRHSSNDIVEAQKPVHIRVAEDKDSQIYTYTEYVERQEESERASRSMAAALDDTRENPVWMLWALICLTLAVMTVVVSIRIRREQLRFDPRLRAVKTFDSPDGPSIGGPFCLTNVHTGEQVTEKDFLGKWLYIYFGFTNCPDVCPQEMAKMSRVIQHLDKKVGKDYWQPLFISLDPKRDTPEKIRDYLADFSPRLIGLVGTMDEVEEAARQYRVYFAVPDDEVMSADDYLVDHSIIMYLMDPAGKFCDYTTKEFQWFESYSKLLRRMMDYERHKVEIQKERALQGEQSVRSGEVAANVRLANIASMLDDTMSEAARSA